MLIKHVTNKTEWESFLETIPITNKSFLHSWSWGEFQKSLGNKIWRIGIYKQNSLIGITLIIKMKAKRGTFLLCPHGPYMNEKKGYQSLFAYVKNLAKEEGASFIRCAPYLERVVENEKLFTENNFIRSPIHTHAERTWLLDITPDEETLLKNMRKTTRYCIRKALREKNLSVETKCKPLSEDIDAYLKLQEETRKRHAWTPYSSEYIKKQVSIFSQNSEVALIMASFNNIPIASAIVFYWQNIGFYYHGASSTDHSHLNAPYLVQWEAIREGKRRACRLYNFWGIADLDTVPPFHPWHGITQFKKGFGGYERKLVHSYDLPISPTYWLTFVFERLRKLKRKL